MGGLWVRTEKDFVRTGHDGRGRLVIGVDGSQWARATLRGADAPPCAIRHYYVLYGRRHFPIGRRRILPHEVNSGIGHIHNNEQEH
jgi:hypothetical protein